LRSISNRKVTKFHGKSGNNSKTAIAKLYLHNHTPKSPAGGLADNLLFRKPPMGGYGIAVNISDIKTP